MIITNDLIKEASLVQQTNIGNMLALDAANSTSYSGSGSKWYDLSGNLNNITWIDQPTFNSNGYFTFNGTSNYGTAPDAPSLGINGYNITMEIWVRFTSFAEPNSIQFPLMKAPYTGGADYFGGNYGLWVEPDFVINPANNGSGDALRGSGSSGNTANTWYQIVYIQNENGYKVMRNGSVLPTVYGDGTPVLLAKTGENLYVGKRKDGLNLYGDLAIINIWDRSLSDVEVLQNYNFYHPRFA